MGQNKTQSAKHVECTSHESEGVHSCQSSSDRVIAKYETAQRSSVHRMYQPAGRGVHMGILLQFHQLDVQKNPRFVLNKHPARGVRFNVCLKFIVALLTKKNKQ